MNGRAARIAVIGNAGLALALASLWVQQAVRGEWWRGDFSSYYFGGVMLRDGCRDRLYDRDLQKQYQARIVPERGETDDLLGFNYPPYSALFAPLFALLPRGPAFYLWTGLQLLLLVPLCRYLRRLTVGEDGLSFAVVLAGVLAFPPLFISFQLGQVSFLLLVCLLGFACNLEAERPFATAFWLVLGAVKPQMLVAPLAILLAGRRWRELRLFAVLMAAWGLAATVFLGPRIWLAFGESLRHSASQFGREGIHPLAMYNLKGFLTSVLGEASAAWINAASTTALLLGTLLIWALGRKPLRSGTAGWDLRLALSLQLGLIVNPHFNPADALVLVVPALLFYRGLRRSGQPAFLVAVVLLLAPILFALDRYEIAVARPAAIHLIFVLMVGLAAAMLFAMRMKLRIEN